MTMLRRLCRQRTLLLVLLLATLTAVGVFHETRGREESVAEIPPSPELVVNFTPSTTANRLVAGWQRDILQHRPSQHSTTTASLAAQLREVVKRVPEKKLQVTTTATPIQHKEMVPQYSNREKTVSTTTRDLPTAAVKPFPSNESRGFALAVDYWEQQTSGSRNLQNLQCWAAQYNLSVVEPAMVGSLLRTPLHDHPVSKGFWFGDVFDLQMWNGLSSKKLHSELVAWETFLHTAPRDVILVSFKHAYPDEIKQNLGKISSSNSSHTPPSQRVQKGCSAVNWEPAKEFLHRNHFHVVRQVCLNFAYGDKLSSEQFKSYLYGPLSPASSTVVFRQWRGTGPPARVLIHDAKCGNTRVQEEVGPSQQLLLAAERYQQRFLGGAPYIAVMARMEKVQSYLRKKMKGLPTLAQCFSKLLATWKETKQQSGLNTTLLAIDMGKFGSNSIHDAGKGSELNTRFEDFFSSVYGTELSLDGWENSFERVAHTTDAGYVALLQKVLVVQAKCVVFIGGGSFQKHAQSLYLQVHHTEQCVRIIRECTPVKNLPSIA